MAQHTLITVSDQPVEQHIAPSGNWFKIDNEAVDSGLVALLDGSDLKVYLAMSRFRNWHTAKIETSQKVVAYFAGVSAATVYRVIQRLTKLQVLRLVRRGYSRQGISDFSEWAICPPEEWSPEARRKHFRTAMRKSHSHEKISKRCENPPKEIRTAMRNSHEDFRTAMTDCMRLSHSEIKDKDNLAAAPEAKEIKADGAAAAQAAPQDASGATRPPDPLQTLTGIEIDPETFAAAAADVIAKAEREQNHFLAQRLRARPGPDNAVMASLVGKLLGTS